MEETNNISFAKKSKRFVHTKIYKKLTKVINLKSFYLKNDNMLRTNAGKDDDVFFDGTITISSLERFSLCFCSVSLALVLYICKV
jgi:hypothetical protein